MVGLRGSMSEWVSEWVIEWRTRADNTLTDCQREATVINIDPSAQTSALADGFSTSLQDTTRCEIATLHDDGISGWIFGLTKETVAFCHIILLYHSSSPSPVLQDFTYMHINSVDITENYFLNEDEYVQQY